MNKTITTLLFAFTFIYFSNAQVSTQLVTITEGSATNSSGLGVYFTGKVMSDGDLYFRGSSNGLRESIWKTDGSINGTSRVMQEDNQFGGNWKEMLFLEEGVILNTNDGWSLLRPGASTLETLDELPSDRFRSIEKVSDGTYYITLERDDNIMLYTCDDNFTDVNEVGIIHPDASFLLLTAGEAGAVIFSTNSFTEDMPVVYLKETNSVIPIEEYLESLSLTISSLTHVYIHDRYMFVSYKDGDNFFTDKVIDMVSKTTNDFQFIRKPLEYFDYDGNLIMVTEREVISLNRDDLSNNQLYSGVFAFTPIQKVDDKIYFITRDNSTFIESVVELNLSDETSRNLPDAVTGNNFYLSEMEYFKNELYYLGESDHQILYKYDFANESPVTVDTLSFSTGATVAHALVKVNSKLVISKRIGSLQHEMFVLGNGGASSISEIDAKDLVVNPTLASDFISVDMESISANAQALIFDMNGQLVSKLDVNNGQIEVSNLKASKYFGFIEEGNTLHRFQFVKI